MRLGSRAAGAEGALAQPVVANAVIATSAGSASVFSWNRTMGNSLLRCS
jgi:hypothetical protein